MARNSKVQTRSPSSCLPIENLPSKRRTRHSAICEIPDRLYKFVQEACNLEKQLQEATSENRKGLESKLEDVKCSITHVAEYYKLSEILQSDWEYDPKTAHTLVPKKYPLKTHTVTKQDMAPNPSLKCIRLVDELWSKAWTEFKQQDAAAGITASAGITYPIDERTLTPLKNKDLLKFIGDFAVKAFNNSHMMYVNNHVKENIHDAQFLKCYYHKMYTSYLFNVTIEAIEQGYAGSYEATVECESDDGAITLDSFVLTDRKPSYLLKVSRSTNADMLKVSRSTNADMLKVSTKRSVYETVKDCSSDPEVCYDVTGMVGRRTKCVGGYGVYNPNGWNRWFNY